jgi:hypothetical protein
MLCHVVKVDLPEKIGVIGQLLQFIERAYQKTRHVMAVDGLHGAADLLRGQRSGCQLQIGVQGIQCLLAAAACGQAAGQDVDRLHAQLRGVMQALLQAAGKFGFLAGSAGQPAPPCIRSPAGALISTSCS